MRSMFWTGVVALLLSMEAAPVAAQSIYRTAPPEQGAVTVAGKGDGKLDDGPAIQRAIDQAADKGGGGIVFLPSGTYRISKTLFLWPGVRIFGVGENRPVILLGANTPGFQRGVSNMLIFAGARERDPAAPGRVPFPPPGSVPFNPNIADANPGTFYSALSNIDFRIGAGNPAAAAIRFHAAQHAYVSHVEFDIGSGLAGLYHVANFAEKLVFRGGRYGILAEKTSPAWPFALVDSTFEGQRDAAIREHEAGLTMVNVSFRDTPVGVEIDEGYGDWLWGQQLRFENVSRAAVLISNENNVYTQVGFQDAVAANTPVFARFRESGRKVAGKGVAYRVSSFTYGLTLPSIGEMGSYETRFSAEAIAALPQRAAPAIRALPPVSDWVDVRSLGARGDDKTDDTAAIQRAIDGHRVVYFPSGFYHVSDTLRLRPDSVLVGLHPSLTQIVLPDRSARFQGVGAPRALVESAAGGDNIVVGARAQHQWQQSAGDGAALDRRRQVAGRRRQVPGRPRHQRVRWCAAQPVQRQPDRRPRSCAPLGRAICQPVGHERRRRHLRQHLEPQHLRPSGHLHLRHPDAGADHPGLGRASRAHRDRAQPRRELGTARAAD